MVKVSVIVPVYNAGEYLGTCLDTLVKQTIDDIEIIAIDDASTDNSFEIMKEYASNYKCLKIFHHKLNLGQGITRNEGLDMANGEYIGFLDADDYVSLTMYEKMYNAALDSGKPDIIRTNLKFVKDNSSLFIEDERDLKGRYYKISDNPNMIVYESPSVCNKLFKRNLIGDYRFLTGVMWEDVAFTFSMLIKADNMLIMNNLDYFYRRDISSGVSSQNYKINLKVFDIIKVAYEIERAAKEFEKYDEFKKQIKFLQMMTCLQRVSEIETWNTDKIGEIKSELFRKIEENFGSLDDVDKDLLSSRADLNVIMEFDEFCHTLKNSKGYNL